MSARIPSKFSEWSNWAKSLKRDWWMVMRFSDLNLFIKFKNIFLFFSTLLIPLLTLSQSTTFNNNGGDNLWSNAAIWSAGIPNVDYAKGTGDAVLIYDSDKTVG